MSREVDRRSFSVNMVTPARETDLHAIAADISARLPGRQKIRITGLDATTGNPRAITSEAATAEKGNYVQRALEFVQNISPALGLAATQPAEFVADPNVQETSSGAVTVHLQQKYMGVPIAFAHQAVVFAPNGALREAIGKSVTISHEMPVSPKLSIQEALLLAAQHVAVPDLDEQGDVDQFGQPLNWTAVDLIGFVPKITATFRDKADQPTAFEAGPFGDAIIGSLVWFPLGNDVRLAWSFIITMPNYDGQYRTIVEADTGEILYCHQLIKHVVARGNVFRVDGGGVRQMTDFPRPWADYGLPIPSDLPRTVPDDWVAAGGTIGNNTSAHQGVSGPVFEGTVQNGLVTFDPANTLGVDQEVLNIFYYCCYMHDYFYLLGFREANGNFQQDNFNRGGVPTDAVNARAHPATVPGTANMLTPVDGQSPIMNMGLVAKTNRHTALDSTVVFHEFTHGVTNRLVGGAQNDHALDDPQSSGMGEGWSDYIACTVNKVVVVGNWVVNKPRGIRNFPYDSAYPHNFGNVGQVVDGIDFSEVHNIGEIWCATLLEMNRNIGVTLGVQLVVDALKLSPANPGFLDMRDSILRALEDMLASGRLDGSQHRAAERGIWAAFAKFGMGICARSNGASLSGIVADFNSISGRLEIGNFGFDAGGWRVEKHPRFLADLTGDGRADIVGFGSRGVFVAFSNGDGTFRFRPEPVIQNFAFNAGGWRVKKHPRFLADLTGDGRADIIGFGTDGVFVSLNNGNGTFGAPKMVVKNFGFDAGNWRVEKHPRFVADLTGDGRADIVGFGTDEVFVSLNNGDGTFGAPKSVAGDFGFDCGNWRVEKHPRFVADLTGDGRADIIGFGTDGVYVSLNNGNGTFSLP